MTVPRFILVLLCGTLLGSALAYWIATGPEREFRAAVALEVERVAAMRPSVERDAALQTHLTRMAALDPRRAVRFAQEHGIGARFIELLFMLWAESDAEAALAELGTLADPATQRMAAFAVLDGAGFDSPRAAERVADALPADRRDAFLRAAVFRQVQHDPRAALANLLTRAPGHSATRDAALEALAAIDPVAVLAALDQLPDDARALAQRTALLALAEQDPFDAAGRIAEMTPGDARNELVVSIAASYAQDDPRAALTWVLGLPPPRQQAVAAVLTAAAEIDFDAAVDLSIEMMSDKTLPLTRVLPLAEYPERIPALADRLLHAGTALIPSLRSLLSTWGRSSPDAAIDWLAVNGTLVDPNTATLVALGFSGTDVEAAAHATSRMPGHLRETWISAVTHQYAQYDPRSALAWLEQHSNEPQYEHWLQTVVGRLHAVDPVAAAHLVDGMNPRAVERLVFAVANSLAQRDPGAAADWVLTQPESRIRTSTLGSVVDSWSRQDATAAERWALRLPQGDERDSVLQWLFVSRFERTGDFDELLLNAIETESARQQAAGRAAIRISNHDPDRARLLLDAHVTDPGLRTQFEQARDNELSQQLLRPR